MLRIEGNQIKKYFGNRLILDIENVKIYAEDRIGIVGPNGVGKTTLMNILSGRFKPDEGNVRIHGKYSYISQLEEAESQKINEEMASRFRVSNTWNENMSGGEKTRFKLALALSGNSTILFADEPTSNLDMEAIELIEKRFQEYGGALVLISHDRSFLDKLCNKIWELEDGKINIYNGNYSDYVLQKSKEKKRAQLQYQQYIKEKKRLEEVIDSTRQKVKSIKRPPKRMGNSEARLHKMGGQKAKATLDRAAKNIEKRIEHLERKEKPKELEGIKLDIVNQDRLYSKILIEGKNIHKTFVEKTILKDSEFKINNGAKVAFIGPNGCGKSTLVKMIVNGEESIKIAKRAKIGYFDQNMNILKENLSIIENVMESSIYDETFARILLARLLFKGEDVYKKVEVLSGGERVKVSFAKILLQDMNLLILDEPTNYMDINSIEVMEEVLKEYQGTLLLVSHDRSFVGAIADHIMTIKDYNIKMFRGTYQEYLEKKDKTVNHDKEKVEKRIFVLKNRMAEVIGKLSTPSKEDDIVALDREYYEILEELKKLM